MQSIRREKFSFEWCFQINVVMCFMCVHVTYVKFTSNFYVCKFYFHITCKKCKQLVKKKKMKDCYIDRSKLINQNLPQT